MRKSIRNCHRKRIKPGKMHGGGDERPAQRTETVPHTLPFISATRNTIMTPAVESFLAGTPVVPSMDVMSPDFSPETFARAYDTFRVVHLRNVRPHKAGDTITWQSLSSIFQKLHADDQKTWCVETKEDADERILPRSFLDSQGDALRAYCSFLIQNDKVALADTLPKLPLAELDLVKGCAYESAIWVFFGRNPLSSSASDLDGRPEHTDSVSHDGTWHYQLSGRKVWTIRASPSMKRNLDQRFAGDWDETQRLTVSVEQGDVLVINTRLWFHQTTIPPQQPPSVSYARDFCFTADDAPVVQDAHMTNVDGLYATEDIEEGTILFREDDMPSCELHRATLQVSNCEVVELDDGTSAVVSTRNIAAGEFFTVPDSDDDDEEDDHDHDDAGSNDGSDQADDSSSQ